MSGGYYIGNESFVSLNKSAGWGDATFTETTAQGLFSLTELNIDRNDRSYNERGGVLLTDGTSVDLVMRNVSSGITGSFVVAAPWSNNQPLSVSVSLSFTDISREPTDVTITDIPGGIKAPSVFQWQQGVIEVTAEDGSSLTVMPTNPASQSFTIELNNDESIGPIPWYDIYIIECGSVEICP